MKHILLLILVFNLASLSGQVGERYSEEDINVQAEMVKATQKKLLRKYDDAITIYERILSKDMHNAAVIYDLSRIYLAQNKEDKAIEYGEKAVKKDKNNKWFKESLAEILMEFKKYDEAAALYKNLAFTENTNQALYSSAIEAYRLADDRPATLEIFEKMEATFGLDSYTAQQIIGVHLNSENYDAALSKAKELIHVYPNDPEYLQLYAQLHADFGSKVEAEKLYKDILTVDPENSQALVFLSKQNNDDNGLSSIKLLTENANVELDAKIKALIPFATDITAESANKETIISLAQGIVTQHPEEAKAHALYGDILNNSDNPKEAAEQYSLALQYDKSVYAIWEQLMFIQYELGNFAGLQKTSSEALDFYPNQAAPYAFNGLAQVNMNNHSDSKEMLAEATLIGSSNPFVTSIIEILTNSVEAYESGDEIVVMNREELFMFGLKLGDPAILKVLGENKYLVRKKKKL